MKKVMTREQVPLISNRMREIAERIGDHAADEYARDASPTIAKALKVDKVVWVPEKMLWREV